MYSQRSTIRPMGIVVFLAGCLALPAWVGAAPPSSNPGQPFAEILAQMGILNDKLDDLLSNGNGDTDLRGVTQNWDKKLLADDGPPCNSSRFTCIFPNDTHPDGAAVRDNETGLVWERSPNNTIRNWNSAISHCAQRSVGGRKGWSLPMVEQLASLLDSSNSESPPALPTGHPFMTVPGFATYWSATTSSSDPVIAWTLVINNFFGNADVSAQNKQRSVEEYAWCVRGGQTFDGNTHNTLH